MKIHEKKTYEWKVEQSSQRIMLDFLSGGFGVTDKVVSQRLPLSLSFVLLIRNYLCLIHFNRNTYSVTIMFQELEIQDIRKIEALH